jgi:1-deoxy-D-xylulose-5-phosphate synthase
MAPKDGAELVEMLKLAVTLDQPVAIRYPKESVPAASHPGEKMEVGKAERLREGKDAVLFAYGAMVVRAMAAAVLLMQKGVGAAVVNARFAKPLDEEMILEFAEHPLFVTLEDHQLHGGFGEAVVGALARRGAPAGNILMLGIPDHFLVHGSRKQLLEALKLDPAGIAGTVLEALQKSRFPGVEGFPRIRVMEPGPGGKKSTA